ARALRRLPRPPRSHTHAAKECPSLSAPTIPAAREQAAFRRRDLAHRSPVHAPDLSAELAAFLGRSYRGAIMAQTSGPGKPPALPIAQPNALVSAQPIRGADSNGASKHFHEHEPKQSRTCGREPGGV